MLDLPIAMFRSALLLALVFFAQSADIAIISPISGDTLRGQVEIAGNMDVPNFASAELAFSYASNPADSWFVIQTFPQPPQGPVIATWDTTSLTDGDYVLHLRVFFQDGSSQDVVVTDLKFRNDVLPTSTPSPTATESFDEITIKIPPTQTLPPLDTPLPTFASPTSMPANPASVTSTSIVTFFGRGALIVLVLFMFFSLILRLRKN